MPVDPVTIRKIGNAAIALGSIQFDDFCNTYSTAAVTAKNSGVTRGGAAQVRSMKPATARRPVSCPAWIAELMAEKVYTEMLPEYNVYGRALLYYGPFKKAIYWNGFDSVRFDIPIDYFKNMKPVGTRAKKLAKDRSDEYLAGLDG
ncbi:hypothetical protein FOZ60_003630 [Perkinsus olseni]|uniref:Uncharacterized protein n=1 Tax=Perkinsus olseni TaxID=32597 RepID=A0A7J6NX69_PEROL|nr:hypothetical protein FOZ60_003630 [Perkinsus olseni]